MPGDRRNRTRASEHSPAIGANRNGTPMLVGKIEIDPARMLSNAHADPPLRSIKLRARFEQIER
jgi:hypothetical protein